MDQLNIRVMFPNSGCMSESPGVLYKSTGIWLAPPETAFNWSGAGPGHSIETKQKKAMGDACAQSRLKARAEGHPWKLPSYFPASAFRWLVWLPLPHTHLCPLTWRVILLGSSVCEKHKMEGRLGNVVLKHISFCSCCSYEDYEGCCLKG